MRIQKNDTAEIKRHFDELAAEIRKVSSAEDLYYYPSTGNLGDALIRVGTERFFSDFGIRKKNIIIEDELLFELDEEYKKVSLIAPEKMKHSTLLYGGGGGWCSLWTGAQENAAKLSSIFAHTIVLPSTYENQVSIENATLYARDKFESMQNSNKSSFCHDMAFYLLFSSPYSINKTQRARTAFCFRKDKESNIKEQWKIPLSNVDLSWKGNFLDSPLPMLEYVAGHKCVHTDRLHVAVSCCLTGTPFYLYPGAYFKNEAIFKTSMEPYFDFGRWREALPFSTRIANSIERKARSIFSFN